MAVFDLFHKREARRRKANQPDVYQYDDLPPALRRQIALLLQSTLGPWTTNPHSYLADRAPNADVWEKVEDVLRRELGRFQLAEGGDPVERLLMFILNASTTEALSAIELLFRIIQQNADQIRGWNRHFGPAAAADDPADAVAELNLRFRENGVGYQMEGPDLVRLDSDYVHAEIVRPALACLADAAFSGADREFRDAHHHYRAGRGREAMGAALRALESTLKTICQERGWSYPQGSGASQLISTVLQNGLVTSSHESHLTGLRTQLESGLPTVSNPRRHGQVAMEEPPDYLVAFALHQAAADVVLLVEAHKALSPDVAVAPSDQG